MHDMRALREQGELLRDEMRRRGTDEALLSLPDRGESLNRARHTLLEGLDDIGLTLQAADAISAFEAQRPAWMPNLERGPEPLPVAG